MTSISMAKLLPGKSFSRQLARYATLVQYTATVLLGAVTTVAVVAAAVSNVILLLVATAGIALGTGRPLVRFVGAALSRRGNSSPVRQWSPLVPKGRRVPDELPPSLSIFRGRLHQLKTLRSRHDSVSRRRAAGLSGTSPILLFLHGPPGIGKTALALKLAHSLKGDYQDGRFYQNLGNGTEPRPAADVLHGFITALGWPKEAIPPKANERAKLFRTLTKDKELLFVLDAVRDAAQLRQVLPSGKACTVIVTSRRALGSSFNVTSLHLPPLDETEALDVFRAVSAAKDDEDLEHAQEIVGHCGRIPLCIRAAADLIHSTGKSTAEVAVLLRDDQSRLRHLSSCGRDIRAKLLTEYRRLSRMEKKAFIYLSLVSAKTFVPWVLRPLLDVSLAEAENLVAALAAAQLASPVAPDGLGMIDRYQLDPLARLLSRELLGAPTERQAKARERLIEAYTEAVDQVLRELDRDDSYTRLPVPGKGRSRWLPGDSALPIGIATPGRAKNWVRSEYPNLVDVILHAEKAGLPELSWRVAAWLGGCVPPEPDVARIKTAFSSSLEAALASVHPHAAIDVLLARGAFLTSIEEYEAAFDDLSDAIARTEGPERDGRLAARGRTARRRCTEALVQMGEHRSALAMLKTPGRPALAESMLNHYLVALASGAADFIPGVLEATFDDELRYWSALVDADRGAQNGQWQTARAILEDLKRHYQQDIRRMVTVSARLTRLYFTWHSKLARKVATLEPGSEEARRLEIDRRVAAISALRTAVACLHQHHAMGNEVGVARSRLWMSRALCRLAQPIQASSQLLLAAEVLNRHNGRAANANSPLSGLASLAQAELFKLNGQHEEAEVARERAQRILVAHGDTRKMQDVYGFADDLWDGHTSVVDIGNHHVKVETSTFQAHPGEPFTLKVHIPSPLIDLYQQEIHDDQVTVALTAGNANVTPMAIQVPVRSASQDAVLEFVVEPVLPGSLPIAVQLFSAADGLLLQEFRSTINPVVTPEIMMTA